MTHEDDMLREIERGEQWLRDIVSGPPSGDVEHLKLRVRIAVDEDWLNAAHPVSVRPGLIDEVKEGVHEELRREVARRRARRRRLLILRPAAGLAAAAAVVFAYIGFVGERESAIATTTTAYIDAFEQYTQDDDLFDGLALLGQEVREIEVAVGSMSWRGVDDLAIDDLRSAIDALMTSGLEVQDSS